jgi:hypothetical protein
LTAVFAITVLNAYMIIHFVAPTTLFRETTRPSDLPILHNGPPGTFVLFPDGSRVSLPTDQIVRADDADGHVQVELGGMVFEGMREGQLTFVRARELLPEDQLSPERSRVMRLDPRWLAAIIVDGSRVWPFVTPAP